MGVALGVSPRSAAALNKLQRYNQEVEDLENEVADIEAALQDYPRTPRARLLEAKDQIAQMNGNLEKLQYSGVDSIITAELESGKERAKEKRKALNQRCDALRERILQDSKDLQRMLAASAGK
jgi:TolA-binding protein